MPRTARRTSSVGDPHLLWFFREAPGAVSGVRSAWGLLEGAGPSGTAPGSRDVPAHRLAAARRETDIASRLERLTVEDRVVLSLAHSADLPWRVPEEARSRLGAQIAPLLPTTRPAQAAFASALRRAAEVEDDRELVFDVEAADGRDAAWRRGEDPRRALDRLLRRGFPDWLYSYARVDDHGPMIREACADARLALRRALQAWEGVAPKPDAEGRTRQRERRRGPSLVELVRPAPDEPLEMFAPAWEALAAE